MRTHVAHSEHMRRLLLAAAVLSLSWALAVMISGGLLLDTPWGTVSSRHPARPFALAGAAILAYVVWFRRYWTSDLAIVGRFGPRTACAAAMVAAFLGSVWWSSFFAAGPDASGYVSQAAMWLRGELTWAAPEWVNAATWPDAGATSAPVGYRPGPATQTIVPSYPPGLPLLMAAFQMVGGPDAVYLVVPACGALAVWTTYRIALWFGGGTAGAVACALLLASPAFLIMLTQPMSDVPAAALWSLAIVAALGGSTIRAFAAGLSVAGAILIRPNLAPLAILIAALVATRSPSLRSGLARLASFGAAIVPAVVTLGALNTTLHGGPLRSGYGPVENLYDADRILPNLASYVEALIATQTPAVLLALGVPLLLATHARARKDAAIILVAYPLAVLALYLPYERMTVWWFLRFLLPAYPALVGGTAVALVLVATQRADRIGVWFLPVAVSLIVTYGFVRAHHEGVFGIREGERRYVAAVDYAKTLPGKSVLISLLHSGTLHHYTGRDVLRWDAMEPAYLDRAIAYLRDRGYTVYLFLDSTETDAFRRRFAEARVLQYIRPEFAVHLPGGVLVFPLDASAGRKAGDDRGAPVHDLGEAAVIEPIRGIGAGVVMRVSERGGVREHDRAIPLLPERPVVRPAHTRNPFRRR